MKIKMSGILFLFLLRIHALCAQDSATAAKASIKVYDNFGVAALMERHKLLNERNIYINGFRIQIAFTNNKEEALKYKTDFYKAFPQMRCYTTYEQPYHKIRVGDYQNLNETKRDLATILQLFPASFVVPDKVRRRKTF
jgi:hypothetical protein